VVKLVTEGRRAKGALVIYQRRGAGTHGAGRHPPSSTRTPRTGAAPAPPDKFINATLRKTLKDKGIKTVVAMGTAGADLGAAHRLTAALKGFKVIVPVDGMSADEVFPELYTAWHLATAARISSNVTLTKFEMIGF
jgi:hypothetical protein